MNPLKETVKRLPKKDSPIQTRVSNVMMLLYTDTTDYDYSKVIKSIVSDSHVSSYAYIEHNRDFFSEETFDSHGKFLAHAGDKKDNHVHVVVNFTSPQALCDISNWFGIEQRFIEKCKKFESALLYLTHRNAEDKTPYDLKEVHSNIMPYIEYLYNSYVPKQTIIKIVWSYIDSTTYPTLTGFTQYIPDEMIPEARKFWGMIRDIIGEAKTHALETEHDSNAKHEKEKQDIEAVKKLCKVFGTVTKPVDNAEHYYAQYTLNENGDLDLLGFRTEEEINK